MRESWLSGDFTTASAEEISGFDLCQPRQLLVWAKGNGRWIVAVNACHHER